MAFVRVTKEEVFFLVLVRVSYFDSFVFSAAILEKGLAERANTNDCYNESKTFNKHKVFGAVHVK